MNERKRKKLESLGWSVGDASDFLDLSSAEIEYIEMKRGLAQTLRIERVARGLTQTDLAGRLGSSQSRVAKMERADSTVSMDLLVRGLLRLGLHRADVARIVQGTA